MEVGKRLTKEKEKGGNREEKEKWYFLHFEMMECVPRPIGLFNKLPSVVRLWRTQREGKEEGNEKEVYVCVCACTQSMYPSHNSIKSISPPTLLPSVLFTHFTAWLIMIKERLTDGSLQSYI